MTMTQSPCLAVLSLTNRLVSPSKISVLRRTPFPLSRALLSLPRQLRDDRPRAHIRSRCCYLRRTASSFSSHLHTSSDMASVFNTSRLLGKTVLITGASGGIGAVRPFHILLLSDSILSREYFSSIGYCFAIRKGWV